MKKILLTIAILIGLTAFGQSIPNSGFENWSIQKWQDPQYFMSSNGNNNNGNIFSVNVTRVTSAYHGKYAAKLTVLKIGADTMPGYLLDGNPSGHGSSITVQGGIPYNQKATGISLHYKYTILAKDTGLILVWFKQKGTIIGQYFIKISDTTSTYKLLTGTFSPALSLTPDTVVFGAATSASIINNGNGMPGSTLTIDSVNFTGVASQPVNLNGDFENWVNDSIVTPSLWEATYGNGGVFRTTDAASGNYAMELITTGAGQHSNQNSPGQADDGKQIIVGSHNDSTVGGYPYTLTSDNLAFDYKYAPADTADRATIFLTFKKNSSIIFGSGWPLKAAASYTHMVIPFSFGTTPDSVLVNIQSSNWVYDNVTKTYVIPNSYVGADLKIDNLVFESQVGIANITPAYVGINEYPNPASQYIYLNFGTQNTPLTATVSVMDILGNEVMAFEKNISSGPMEINIAKLPAGIYFVKIMTANSASVAKFIKQ